MPKKHHPLWTFMPRMAASPGPPRHEDDDDDDDYEEREPSEGDNERLRVGSAWRPSLVLKSFRPARSDAQHVPRLLVACAVLQGVHRILDLTERLLSLLKSSKPRITRMLEDDALEPRHEELQELLDRLGSARNELLQTRARAANDIDGEPVNPDGLLAMDLEILSDHAETLIMAHELSSRRNVTGIDFAMAIAVAPPDLGYAEEWVERLLGSAEMTGVLLFWPEDYERVLVVYEDGRLAYDPGATTQEEEPEDEP